MSIDLEALIQQLAAQPDLRAQLRSALLGDAPDLVDALARLAVRVEELAKDIRELAKAQRNTEGTLATLVDVTRDMQGRLARVDGESLERRYRDKGHAYFGPIARRLRLVPANDLSVMVDDAVNEGVLTAREANEVLLADGVFAGRRGAEDVHLVMEASVTINHTDVRRARERADLVARVVGTPVIPVVAGEFAPSMVAQAAQESGVWQVTNGHVLGPEDDLPGR